MSVKAIGAVVMAGELKRVASKASTTNGSKGKRGSHTLWLLCLDDDGARPLVAKAGHGRYHLILQREKLLTPDFDA